MTTSQIWAEYAQEILRYFQAKVGNNATAEDLRQEVFLKVHNGVDALKEKDKVQHWLRVIARNVLVDYWNNTKPLTNFEAINTESAIDQHFYHMVGQCVHRMIDTLPEKYRLALKLSDLDEIPQKEVAHILSISLSAAKSRIQRGREKLLAAITTCCHIEMNKRGEPVEVVCGNKYCDCCV